MPVLQPLIGMDKEDIIRIAQGKIGTFLRLSVPALRGLLHRVHPAAPQDQAEGGGSPPRQAAMDVRGLVAEALEGIERIWIDIEG
ncbi:MAG: hypothetical protein ACLTSG_12485 [Lachnospiraceae bacterium]